MKRASKDIVINVQGLLDPVARTVNLSAVMGVNRQGSVRQPELERTLLEGLSERREGMAQGFTRDMHQTRERLA
jgi:hypothetical protein